MARRFFWLTVIILFVLTGYAGGWYWAAGRLVDEVRARTGKETAFGRVECTNPEARGFPFRIGLFCDSIGVERSGVALSAGALRSAAQIYNPFRLVAETDGPAQLDIAGLVPFDIAWDSARASARLAMPLPETVSTEFVKVSATARMSDSPQVLAAERLELHGRQNGRDLDVAMRFDGLSFGAALIGGELPPVSGIADIAYVDGVARFGRSLRGGKFTVRKLDIAGAGQARLTATGTASVRGDGLVDADLVLTATDLASVGAAMVEAFPQSASQIASVFAGLSALGAQPSLPLTIRAGAVSLGFVPIGDLPPI